MATQSSNAQTRAIREYVIEHVSPQTTRFTMQVAEKFGISRQAAHRYIKRLVNEGILTASGETKDRRYALKPIVDESFEIPITFKFDLFTLSSGNLLFTHDEPGDDWLLEEETEVQGTTVVLQIALDSKRTLKQVLDQYTFSQDEFGFSRTIVPVRVARYGDENLVSRSQAKRLLTRLQKFQEVIFDFQNVEIIGQAFADEIFRVFANEHPQVNLTWINANDQVEKMIRRAKANSLS